MVMAPLCYHNFVGLDYVKIYKEVYMNQNLNLYQIFYEVAKCHNFSMAAKKLYISQPAISKAIAKLEENLDTLLFTRNSKGVLLTAEGELLFKQVEAALLSILSGEEQLKRFSGQGMTPLSIGVSTTLCKYVLLPELKNFMADNPHIQINISCQSTFETIQAIKEGLIDIGLVGIPETEAGSDVTFVMLKEIQDIFVTSGHSPKGELLENASFIMLDKGNISRKHVDAYLARHHIVPRHIMEVNNMDLSIEFARAGLGIACVIQDFVGEDLQKGILDEVQFPYRIPKRRIGFAYPGDGILSPALTAFIHHYQKCN